MAKVADAHSSLPERLRAAYLTRDLEALGALLADDVHWGDDDLPRRCRNRSEVLATFARGMDAGADAEITELLEGTNGILCGLVVRWPDAGQRPGDGRLLYHVYLTRDERIAEIRRYDDRASAAEAAGVTD